MCKNLQEYEEEGIAQTCSKCGLQIEADEYTPFCRGCSNEELFEQQFESLKNGNITLFKEWLKESNEVYDFIKWLQGNRLKI